MAIDRSRAVDRKTVAIFGGSFNPPHVAHVLVASYVLQVKDIDEVWIEPVFAHPLGKPIDVTFEQRVAMCTVAFADLNRRVVVREDERENPTGRTFDLLALLGAAYPNTTFRIVIGSDLLHEAAKWHNFEQIREKKRLLVVRRPGYAVPPGGPDQVLAVEMPGLSSHRIRAALELGREVRDQLPVRVQRYIDDQRLYRPNRTGKQLLVIGGGKLGTALAAELHDAGWDATLYARTAPQSAGQPAFAVTPHWPHGANFAVAIVAVPDRALPEIIAQNRGQPLNCPLWLHTAGALPSDALRDVAPNGVVGALHPLCAVAGPTEDNPLHRALYAIGGDPAAQTVAKQLAKDLQGEVLEIADRDRVAYHAAAALVANDWVALFAAAGDVAAAQGLPAVAIRKGLLHLAKTALDRLAALDPSQPVLNALTGAVGRGDAATLAGHLAALAGDPAAQQLHSVASQILLDRLVALQRLTATQAAAMRQTLANGRPLPL